VTLPDNRTFTVDTRNEVDFRNINGLATKSALMLLQGDATTTSTFRDADNVDQVMTAPELAAMAQAVGAGVDALYKKSWALRTKIYDEGYAGDVTDNEHWE
jgi:hypothetical protein